MTKTNNEVKFYMKLRQNATQEVAATRAGMSRKTAGKYEKINLLPSDLKQPRSYRTRKNPFEKHNQLIQQMFIKSPRLTANTILKYLMDTFPDAGYGLSQLRTLERMLTKLRITNGPDQEVYFPQDIKPGEQSQSDWSHMEELNITISGNHLKHLIFHFMLPYSLWESVDICYSESFDSLANGYQKAVFELGACPRLHKTDNSSTATKTATNGRDYTSRYTMLLNHYKVTPIKNNPGKGNENGSVEKSHDLFKKAVDQALLIRGSRDFSTLSDYQSFLENLVKERNQARSVDLAKELPLLQQLPNSKYECWQTTLVSVNKFSMVQINRSTYSVPTKLIGTKLQAFVGLDQIKLYAGSQLVLTMPKVDNGYINYRHIIKALVKKPGAFLNYKYRSALYPQLIYKQVYEQLEQHNQHCVKEYLRVLVLATDYGEQKVATLLQQHLSQPKPKWHDLCANLELTLKSKVPPISYNVGGNFIKASFNKYATLNGVQSCN